MKKVYNKYSTSDIPLDASLSTPSSNTVPKKTTSTKPTIKAIGTKAKTSVKTKTTTANNKGAVRKKIAKDSIDLQELEKLNEENISNRSFRSKRNQVIIIILSLLLAIAIAFIVVYAIYSKVENNCFLKVNGDVPAVYIVNGEEIAEFRSPANIQGECILEVDVDLKIQEAGEFDVKFTAKCYYKDQPLLSVVVYEPDTSSTGLFTYKDDGYYHSKLPIQGNTTINLCRGVALNEFDVNIDDDNFRLEFDVFIKRV